MNRVGAVVFFLAAPFLFSACQGSAAIPPGFQVVDAKMCRKVDAERNPIDTVSAFPEGTGQVFCWFAWKEAKPGLDVVAMWYYASEE